MHQLFAIRRRCALAFRIGRIPGGDAKGAQEVGHAKPGEHTSLHGSRGECARDLERVGRPPGIGEDLAQRGSRPPAGVQGDAIDSAAHVKEADGRQIAILCLGDKVADAVR